MFIAVSKRLSFERGIRKEAFHYNGTKNGKIEDTISTMVLTTPVPTNIYVPNPNGSFKVFMPQTLPSSSERRRLLTYHWHCKCSAASRPKLGWVTSGQPSHRDSEDKEMSHCLLHPLQMAHQGNQTTCLLNCWPTSMD